MRDELEVIEAVKWCWDNRIRIYPVIHPLPSEMPRAKNEAQRKDPKYFTPAGYKSKDKVRICVEIGSKKKVGEMVFEQDDSLYRKIEDLYIHYYNNRTV